MLADMLKDKASKVPLGFGKKKAEGDSAESGGDGDMGLALAKALSSREGAAIERLICDIVEKHASEGTKY